MGPDDKEMLEDIKRLTEDNNRMLRSMHRGAIASRYMRILYWLIVLGVSVWIYYVLQPYLGTLGNLLKTAQSLQGKLP